MSGKLSKKEWKEAETNKYALKTAKAFEPNATFQYEEGFMISLRSAIGTGKTTILAFAQKPTENVQT